jgi:RNA polymerase sigma-70 factor (ECF subfamily)
MRKIAAKTHTAGKNIFARRIIGLAIVYVLSFAQSGILPGGQRMRRVPSAHEVTVLLRAWGGGSEKALDRLAPLVYRELRQMAGRMMAAERPNHTLQPTALVNEAYLRLVDARQVSWQDRAHFFGICARAMRQILVDHARSRTSAKRGGGEVALELEEGLVAARAPEVNLLELDDVLNRLAELDPRKSQVVEMRYFAGLSLKETAEALKVSAETVRRDWKMAQAWLHRELSRNKQDE